MAETELGEVIERTKEVLAHCEELRDMKAAGYHANREKFHRDVDIRALCAAASRVAELEKEGADVCRNWQRARILELERELAEAKAELEKERKFPVMDSGAAPSRVPWSWVAEYEGQALRNHGQSLERLASRGGLCPAELWAAVHGKGLSRPIASVVAEEWLASRPWLRTQLAAQAETIAGLRTNVAQLELQLAARVEEISDHMKTIERQAEMIRNLEL